MKSEISLPQTILASIVLFLFVILSSCKTSTDPSIPVAKQGISGIVTSKSSGSKIAGALVRLANDDATGAIIDSTTSGNDGSYVIDGVPPGKYKVYCSAPNYNTLNQSVTVFAQTNAALNFELVPLNSAYRIFHVQDAETLKPIVGATVKAVDCSNWSQLTGADGNAGYDGNCEGSIHFQAAAFGYMDATIFVDVERNHPGTDTISLINPEEHLIASYRFAGNFLDSSGKGHDGMRHGCTFATDRFGNPSNALQCNGTTDFISVADAADLNFGKTTDFSICLWLNPPQPPAVTKDFYLLNKGTIVNTVFTGYSVDFLAPNPYISASAGTTYGGVGAYYNGQNNVDNRWHFLAFVFSRAGKVSAYYDGKLYIEKADPNGFLQGNINTAAKLVIGGNGVSANAYKGLIDDIKIYNIALSDSTVNKIYHENGW